MSEFLSKDFFLAQNDTEIEKVELPKPYNGCLYVRSMTGTEWDDYQSSITKTDAEGKREVDLQNIRVKLLLRTICDEHGNLLFGPEDTELLAKKSSRVLEKLTKAAQRLNGVGEDSDEKK